MAPIEGMRSKLLRRAPAVVLLFGAALGVWAFWIEPRTLVVNRQTLALPDWPFEGLKVAAISDIHTGSPHNPLKRVRSTVERLNAEKPDLVLLLGDYVISSLVGTGIPGGSFVSPDDTARSLSAIHARYGVVGVLGNHDWWHDGEKVRRAFEANRIPILENEALEVRIGERNLFVAGLADEWTRKVDILKALATVPIGAPTLVLTHSPDVFPDVPPRVSLTLAGHTHGGQVRFPLVGAPIVPSRFGQRYSSGHIVEDGRHLYVTTGVGLSILPVRFRVPPEIALLTLVRAK